ncbi:DUF1269 domain-containing protein [Glutamicibacter sp.]|uniref:DUF1269 domain-containing protein n=1 Tax=Glutamicibacter sp. TaxID=1931995 RepID=UPI0028BDA841|nr:DUF1269 domain-containing protein [Glutamicibacter sp.]
MATLTVWKFHDATGADSAERVLLDLQTKELIQIHDAAIVSWENGAKKPKTKQLNHVTGASALGGTFWGFLFGLIFFVPLLGAAMGAAMGAMSGSLTDVGIDDSFIKRVRDEVVEGTSAIFVLSSDATTDRVAEAFAGTKMELLETNLSHDEEAKLRGVFAND